MTIGYVTLGTHDLLASLPFFDAVLGGLGYARGEPSGGWAFYQGPGGAAVGVCSPHDGQPARAGNGIMIAFKADGQDAVKAAHAAALANGGSDEGGPGFRPPEGTEFYGAYFRDAVGNKFCVYTTP